MNSGHDAFEKRLGKRLEEFADTGLPSKTPDQVAQAAMQARQGGKIGASLAVGVLAVATVVMLQMGVLRDIGGASSTSPEASTSPVASTSPEASVPYDGVRPPTGPPIEPESNTRSFTPMIESPEIGVDYHVYLSLHCGYTNFWRLRFGGTEWSFTENGSGDSIFVEGTLRLISADSATLTVDGVAHPLVPATDSRRCL